MKQNKFITTRQIFNEFGIDTEIREMNTGNLYPKHETLREFLLSLFVGYT